MIVGKMVKFTIDGKYKVDKADILPDSTRLVAIDGHHRVGSMG